MKFTHRKLVVVISFFFLFLLTFSFPSTGQAEFVLESHFPNVFLNSLDPHHKPVSPEEIQAAVDSLAHRLAIPYIPPGKQSHELTNHGFLSTLQSEIQKNDPRAKVYLSGGVIRSLLGYLYEEVVRLKQIYPRKSTQDILKIITSDLAPVTPFQALGVNSDFDVLIEPGTPPNNGKSEAHKHFIELESIAKGIINSARNSLKLNKHQIAISGSLLPEADVKPYPDQILEASAQGGSTLDLLAFELGGGPGRGKIITPDVHKGVLEDFIQGRYQYLAPTAHSKYTSTEAGLHAKDKQTIRGLRPLLEIPFLKISDQGKEIIKAELQQIYDKILQNHPLSEQALQQFFKCITNSRFNGAKNRFLESNDDIEKLIRKIAEAVGKLGTKNLSILPEFLPSVDIASRQVSPRPDLDSFLMTTDNFRAKYTNKGEIYHGTAAENVGSILRQTLAMSKQEHGKDSFGSGAYGASSYNAAMEYAGGLGRDGMVLSLKLKDFPSNSPHQPRILNWDDLSTQNPELMKKLIFESEKAGFVDCFKYLAEKYGIDIIVHEHVLVQNSDVLRFPKSPADLIHIQGESLFSRTVQSFKTPIDQEYVPPKPFLGPELARYSDLYTLASLEKDSASRLVSPSELFEKMVKHIDPGFTHSSHLQMVSRALEHHDPLIQALGAGALALPPAINEGSLRFSLFQKAFHSSNPEVRRQAAYSLGSNSESEAIPLFELALRDPETGVSEIAAQHLSQFLGHLPLEARIKSKGSTGTSLGNLYLRALNDPRKEVGEQFAMGLNHLQETSPGELALLINRLLQAIEPKGEPTASSKISKTRAWIHLTQALSHPALSEDDVLFSKFLESDDASVRRKAFHFLSHFKGKKLHAFYESAFNDPDSEIRKGVLENLKTYEGNDLSALLQIGLKSDKSKTDVLELFSEDFFLANPDAFLTALDPMVMKFLPPNEAQRLFKKAKRLLVTRLFPGMNRIFFRLLDPENPVELRRIASEALSNSHLASQHDLRLKALSDSDSIVRQLASYSLRAYTGKEWKPLLEACLKIQDRRFEEDLKQIFFYISSPHPHFFEALNYFLTEHKYLSINEKQRARKILVKALEANGIHPTPELLADILRDEDPTVRYSGVLALSRQLKYEPQEALLPLVSLAFHDSDDNNHQEIELALRTASPEFARKTVLENLSAGSSEHPAQFGRAARLLKMDQRLKKDRKLWEEALVSVSPHLQPDLAKLFKSEYPNLNQDREEILEYALKHRPTQKNKEEEQEEEYTGPIDPASLKVHVGEQPASETPVVQACRLNTQVLSSPAQETRGIVPLLKSYLPKNLPWPWSSKKAQEHRYQSPSHH